MCKGALEVRKDFQKLLADAEGQSPEEFKAGLRALPGRPPGAPLMGESRNRVGGAYALTTFAPIIPGHEEELRAHIEGLPDGAEQPARAARHAAPLAHPDLRPTRAPGRPKHDLDRLESSYLVFTSSFDGDLDTLPRPDLRAHPAPRPTAGGATASAIREPPTARAFKTLDQDPPAPHATCSPRPTRRARVAEVRESLALRDQLVDFAADAQGLDAAALKERFLSTFAKAVR